MRFATWNVNSIRTRVDRVIAFLQRSDTDVLAMQEIKCRPDQFPIEPFEKAGYHVAIHGLNQWNGVAVASRLPILDIQDHFPTQPAFGEPPVVEARALGVTIDTTDALPPRDGQASSMTIWSLYVPNGRELTHAHYTYKLQWLANLAEQGRRWLSDPEARIALVGDWNVAPLDEDVWDMSVFEGATPSPPTAGSKSRESASPTTPTGTTRSYASPKTRACASTSPTARPHSRLT